MMMNVIFFPSLGGGEGSQGGVEQMLNYQVMTIGEKEVNFLAQLHVPHQDRRRCRERKLGGGCGGGQIWNYYMLLMNIYSVIQMISQVSGRHSEHSSMLSLFQREMVIGGMLAINYYKRFLIPSHENRLVIVSRDSQKQEPIDPVLGNC